MWFLTETFQRVRIPMSLCVGSGPVHVRKSVVQCVSERQKTQTKQNEKMR